MNLISNLIDYLLSVCSPWVILHLRKGTFKYQKVLYAFEITEADRQ